MSVPSWDSRTRRPNRSGTIFGTGSRNGCSWSSSRSGQAATVDFAYVIGDRDAGQAVVIDPSYAPDDVVGRAQAQGLSCGAADTFIRFKAEGPDYKRTHGLK